MLKVSVVIPAYNAAKYLPAAIESILSQTFQDFEVIILDDCSTDNTWDVIQEYAKRNARIRPFRNLRNLGIAGNRNKGVSLATGKYLVWQDADDISLPTRIEKQLHFMELHPEVGIVGGYIELFRDQTNLGVRKYPSVDAAIRQCIFRYSPIAQPAAMIRMEVLLQVGEYDLKYPPAEDLDMTFRIGEKYVLANLQEVVLRYRESNTSATSTRLKKMEMATLEIRRKNSLSADFEMSFGDRVYNYFHYLSVWLIPPGLKIRLFNWWRNSVNQ